MRKLKEIMSKDCVTVTLQDNVYHAALKMKQHNIGFIPVVDGKKLIGVVTDRDLVIRGFAENKSGSAMVGEVMSNGITAAAPETTVEEAAKMMAEQRIRRLPVVENGELCGVVAIADLAVRDSFEDEAGKALSEISEPSQTGIR